MDLLAEVDKNARAGTGKQDQLANLDGLRQMMLACGHLYWQTTESALSLPELKYKILSIIYNV